MKIFARINGRLVAYEGMSQEVIVSMLAEDALVPEFIDESAYLTGLAALEGAK